MTKLQWYIFKALIGPFLAITIGLSFLGIITQSLTQLDLLVEHGQSPLTILFISLLSTPQFMTVVAPIAMFASTILVYSRLYSENELVVAMSSGMSLWKITEPAIRLSAMIGIAVLCINIFVQPLAYQIMREKLFAIKTDIATTFVKEGTFTSPAKNLMVYTRKIGRGGQLNGLIISDLRKPDFPVTYTSKEAYIIKIGGMPSIIMNDVDVHRITKNNTPELVSSSQYVFSLDSFQDKDTTIFFKPSDRETYALFTPDPTSASDKSRKNELLGEAHRRFSAPLNTIAASFLGVMSILGSGYSRRGYAAQIAKYSGAALFMLLIQSSLISTVQSASILNILQYLVPISFSAFVIYKMKLFKNWNSSVYTFESKWSQL